MLKIALRLLVAGALVSLPAFAQLYRWTDDKGVIHYSDKAPVKMLATSWCGYCARARAYLNSRGIPFEELDVEKSARGKQEYRALKGRGVPIILVGDQRMNGYDQARLEGMLRAGGH
jgi:glutaredoxin